MYISIGPSPTIDNIYGLPLDISIGSSPTIDILSFRQPSNNSYFRKPSEPFSLDSSHALTPIVLGCSSAYGMHVCQFQYSQIHMQIYKHEYIHIKIKSHNHVM